MGKIHCTDSIPHMLQCLGKHSTLHSKQVVERSTEQVHHERV